MTSIQEMPPRNTTVSIKLVLANPGDVLITDFMHCGWADGLVAWPAWKVVCCGGSDLWYSRQIVMLEQSFTCRCGREVFVKIYEGVIELEHR